MGRRQPLWQTFGFSILFTVVWAAVSIWSAAGAWQETARFGPFFFVMIFFTMLATNRVSASVAARAAARQAARAPQRGPAVIPPTGERIDHNQRRRQRAERARSERRRR
jgi:hypothetical protein